MEGQSTLRDAASSRFISTAPRLYHKIEDMCEVQGNIHLQGSFPPIRSHAEGAPAFIRWHFSSVPKRKSRMMERKCSIRGTHAINNYSTLLTRSLDRDIVIVLSTRADVSVPRALIQVNLLSVQPRPCTDT